MALKRLMEPRTIAVFGVSRSNPFHPANVIYHKNHLRYGARTYGINLKGGELFGQKLYTGLDELPEPIDCAVLAVRAQHTPAAVRECIEHGVGGVIVISGGFAETGHGDLQDELSRLSAAHDLPIIGPNCLGVYSPPAMNTFFLPPERLVAPRPGRVSIVSQSGGILIDTILAMTHEGVGVARAVSIGNKAAVDEVDVVEWLETDPNTDVIALYVEGFLPGRGRDFVQLVDRMTKPVVIMKSGKTPGGSKAVSSHTASIAGDYRVFNEIIGHSKAIEAASEYELVAACEALACCQSRDKRTVCVVTASGGHGALASDGLYAVGMEMPDIEPEDQARLRERFNPSVRPIASVANPIDLTGSATDNDFYEATRFALEHDAFDAVLLLLLPYLPALTAHVGARIAALAHQVGKPVVCYIPHVDKYGIFVEGFEANGVPVAHSVRGAVEMIRTLGGEA